MNTVFDTLTPWTKLLGRLLISFIFIAAGFSKIGGFEATQGYMASAGVPAGLLPLVIVTELGGGLMIAFGLFTRYTALALAGFSIISGLLFHGNSADQVQQIMLMKNFAMAGGFLFLVAQGAGKISLDQRFGWS